ncbi:MAG TPA: trypsin-like peptidase domain-containing protein [Phycisphaerae bacterium]|nr:trypsin-like peptidase domain-containing protein [Phycisphaerae bacterium]
MNRTQREVKAMAWKAWRGLVPAAALLMAAAVAAPAALNPDETAVNPAAIARAVEQAILRASEKVAPAVVNIVAVREVAGPPLMLDGSPRVPDVLPDELRERLRDELERRRVPLVPFQVRGNGSGFIISAEGHILTSEHVVRDAVRLEVTLADRRRYHAEAVGADPRRDLAVIRIDAQGLPVAQLGDASKLARGQFVIALGSPFGFGRDGQASLSFGIVSGTGRTIPGIGRELDRYYGNLIQTDAAINPGNSGGPLVDLEGKVVGVNAVISSRDGFSDGVGFAVPITRRTKAIIERLKRGERIVYGFLGVEIHEVTEAEADQIGAEVGEGAYVSKVLAGMPAAEAGLRPGDVVLRVGDTPVHEPDDLIQIVQAALVGEKVVLTVLRDGERREIAVEVGRRPAPEALLASAEGGRWWRGMRVVPLSDELREQTGLEAGRQGVFVREVRDGSPAAAAEIVPGMVIDQVGPTKIASVREFAAATAEGEGPVFVHVASAGIKIIKAPGKDAPDPGGSGENKDRPGG